MNKTERYGGLGTMACSILIIIGVFVVDGLTQSPNAGSAVLYNSSLAVQTGTQISIGLLGEIAAVSAMVISGIIVLSQIVSEWLKNRRYDKEWGYSLNP